ncbi:stage V sporulation protein B [Terrilactibacillus sp. BCM23-1]|uniref:Stage V sporulation protein B n=1 Tax=Terrilactibacillus tamarindi TaxID=2599694 RepID=A0A6N8CVR6_9BACI|nr:stage V sporulation protein B [Terrilactibacillus tamarindi]MTT32436.1 stage V sporulation protein B [Terrilactibacillus tamarindi]
MSKQSFLKGSFILMLAGLVTKILGMINKIVLSRVIGNEGVGIYMMAYPTLLLTVTLTQLGLPVAISKMVAEADVLGDKKKIKRILVVSFTIVTVLSIVLATVMVILGPLLSHTVFTDSRTLYPLIAISPVIPIVGIASVLRGYFQGMRHMTPFAFSEVIEQIVRISLVAFLATMLMPYGIEYAAGGAMISGVIGEFISLLYMLSMFKKSIGKPIKLDYMKTLKSGKKTCRELMDIALPSMGSRLIGSISSFLDPIITAQSLLIAGVSTVVATKQYGELAGYVIPFLTLPSFITHALYVSLIPTISEEHAKKNYHIIHFRLNQALKMSMLSGGISIVICYVFAEPLMALLYHSPGSSHYVYLMAPFFIVFYLQGPLQAVLQALNLARAALINSFLGAVVKLVMIWALASKPEFGINGVALGIVISMLLVTLLHLATVIKVIGFSLEIMDFVKEMSIIIASGMLATYLLNSVFTDWAMLPRTLTLIFIVFAFYLLLAFWLELISREELSNLPIIGKWIKIED